MAGSLSASPPASPGRPDEGRKVQRKWKRAAKKFVKLLSEDGGKYGRLLTRAQQAAIATNDAHMGKAFALYQMISYDEDGNNDGEKKYQVEEGKDNAAAAADFVADLKTAIPEVFA